MLFSSSLLLKPKLKLKCSLRWLNTQSSLGNFAVSLKRSYLYVPCSSDRMLGKSLTTNSDMIIYDLEDSVPLRNRQNCSESPPLGFPRGDLPPRERVAVRVNDITTPFFWDDITNIVSSKAVGSLVLPKVHSAEDMDTVSNAIHAAGDRPPLGLVASIESARASWNIGAIAGWKSNFSRTGGKLMALLASLTLHPHFISPYESINSPTDCADTAILRSPSRLELLYTRSQIVIAAKAFGLEAIDMVCVNYKDLDYLQDECRDGRQLGFTGKQAIHPIQVDVIQSTFVPTAAEIERAAKIVHKMARVHALNLGATGLEGEMIDKPMILQADKILNIARAANFKIPQVDES
ncbi:Pyruvate/Phosphoenolpyruvate kinase-like domain-containing protein [Mycena rosella]|uniref:Pyruvate/Phosphoenolpyruvate kinase-like domain-containing protein n=1 Tax=Mycena rosella TaxID=1033263 RepID=A0AAD7DNY0_MYCRO|nr:Pyruvate/Phosphoenolpyruvate kinase-like domain-containing protein [Mycena rosella]